MLGWAGLRGAIPIWLATFPVIEGLTEGPEIFNIIFFVVVTSTLIQGATFEPLARRLGVTSDEPALPRPLVESGRIGALGGEVFAYRVDDEAAIVGRPVRDLGLPREAQAGVDPRLQLGPSARPLRFSRRRPRRRGRRHLWRVARSIQHRVSRVVGQLPSLVYKRYAASTIQGGRRS